MTAKLTRPKSLRQRVSFQLDAADEVKLNYIMFRVGGNRSEAIRALIEKEYIMLKAHEELRGMRGAK